MAKSRASYGVDAPWITFGFILGGACFIVLQFVQTSVRGAIYPGISFFVAGMVMLWGSLVGKMRLRDRIFELVSGDAEEILDVGCGHGLMLIGAAKRFPKARLTGIDLWRGLDQASNSREATMANCKAEGVADRVELVDGDARDLPFENDRFDVVLSSFAIHNIPDANGRKKAILEAVRVAKPGGRLEIVDIFKFREYEQTLKEAGLTVEMVRVSAFLILTTYWVRAVKPGNSEGPAPRQVSPTHV